MVGTAGHPPDRACVRCDGALSDAAAMPLCGAGGAPNGTSSTPERRVSDTLDENHHTALSPSAAGTDEAEGRRASSPMIRWRPFCNVRIATCLPPEMMMMDGEEGGSGAEPFPPAHSTDGKRNDVMRDTVHLPSTVKQKGVKANTGFHSGTGLNKGPYEPLGNVRLRENGWRISGRLKTEKKASEKRRYGAWYLPPEEWNTMEYTYGGSGAQSMRDKGKKSAEYQKGLEKQIVSLYSAKVYKEWLKRTGEKIPYYLARVESPVKRHRRTSMAPQITQESGMHLSAQISY